jgi:hypothetical protein
LHHRATLLSEKPELGKHHPARGATFQSRRGDPGQQPLLTLDLVPTGQRGEVRLYLCGKPHGGVKATLRTPDDKEKELTVDAEGFIRFESSQSGQHMLSVAHQREPIPGFHLGVPYEQTSHNAALIWQAP